MHPGGIFFSALLLSLAPIWRGAGHPRTDGVDLWRLLYDSTRTEEFGSFGQPHIPYEEAKQRALDTCLEIRRNRCLSRLY